MIPLRILSIPSRKISSTCMVFCNIELHIHRLGVLRLCPVLVSSTNTSWYISVHQTYNWDMGIGAFMHGLMGGAFMTLWSSMIGLSILSRKISSVCLTYTLYMTFPIGYAMANKAVFAEVDNYPNVLRKTEVNSCMSFVFWSDTLKLCVFVVCICIYY